MPEPRARVFQFAVTLDRIGRATAEEATLEVPGSWKPEHLVLAGLLECSLTSLRYHAGRLGIAVEARGAAQGTVTRREEDGRFAFVAIDCHFDVRLDPAPADVPGLLARAERDCFVGASLTATPRYAWSVT